MTKCAEAAALFYTDSASIALDALRAVANGDQDKFYEVMWGE